MKIIEREIWKPVAGYERCYSVSTSGNIKRTKATNSTTAGRERSFYKNKGGYLELGLWENNKRVVRKVHRLVAITFLGNPPKGLEVNHKDGIKTNNHVSNLEYVTHSENVKHGYRLGLYKPRNGENHHMAKMKEKDVLKIRELFSGNICTQSELSQIYKISSQLVHSIVRRKKWTHI